MQQIVAVALGLAEKSVELRTETVRRPPEKHRPPALERLRKQIGAALDWLQGRLASATQDHLVLERLTQADLTTAIAVTNLYDKNPELLDHGLLVRWTERCEATFPLRSVPFMPE